LSVNIGSFRVILTGDQTVPDVAWTKIVFDEVEWDTVGRFDLRAGCFKAERDGRHYFMAGARLLAPTAAWCSDDLMGGKTPDEQGLRRASRVEPDRVTILSERSIWGQVAQRLTVLVEHEVVAATGDIFEVYIRHDCGERAYLSRRRADAADDTKLEERHPTYFMGMWHA
jgi:hypothetical protein